MNGNEERRIGPGDQANGNNDQANLGIRRLSEGTIEQDFQEINHEDLDEETEENLELGKSGKIGSKLKLKIKKILNG